MLKLLNACLTAVLVTFMCHSIIVKAETNSPTDRYGRVGAAPMNDEQVFKDFGGKEGLVRLMDDFMNNLVADPRTKAFFDTPKQSHIKAMLVEQICEILHGGCKYQGRDMKAAHANMRVNRAAFNALVEDFQLAMDKNQVPFRSQNKLLAKLAPMYRDIITTSDEAVPPTN